MRVKVWTCVCGRVRIFESLRGRFRMCDGVLTFCSKFFQGPKPSPTIDPSGHWTATSAFSPFLSISPAEPGMSPPRVYVPKTLLPLDEPKQKKSVQQPTQHRVLKGEALREVLLLYTFKSDPFFLSLVLFSLSLSHSLPWQRVQFQLCTAGRFQEYIGPGHYRVVTGRRHRNGFSLLLNLRMRHRKGYNYWKLVS